MAKKNSGSTSFSAKGFILAGIILFIVFSVNIAMLFINYGSTTKTYSLTSSEMTLINSSKGSLSAVNKEVVEIVAGIGNIRGHNAAIEAQFEGINAKLDAFEAMGGHNETALHRFKFARAYIDAYANKIAEYRNELNRLTATGTTDEQAAFMAKIPYIYDQEIAPLETAAGEMMVACIQITTAAANRKSAQQVNQVYVLMGIMIAILVVCEIALFFFARFNKRSVEEIERKNKQVAEASSKLVRSREKMEAAVQTNFLTGFKNRYSLEQDIGERLATDEFNIAAFDLDNFKSINDMYGYDFGDEYLVQIADRLKNEFGQIADIYNITGNEFVFVFKREVSDSQTVRYVESIVAAMNAPYTIFNLTVQLTVTAASYHYLAGDCLNVNSLLVKMDNVIRGAKRTGGGQIVPVSDL